MEVWFRSFSKCVPFKLSKLSSGFHFPTTSGRFPGWSWERMDPAAAVRGYPSHWKNDAFKSGNLPRIRGDFFSNKNIGNHHVGVYMYI